MKRENGIKMSFAGILCRLFRRFRGNVPVLKTCCGCWSVKLGAAVLGASETVVATLQLVLLAASCFSTQWDLLQEELQTYDVVFEVSLACTNVVGLFVNVLLLMGVGKGKAKLVFPAVIYYFLFVCLYCVVLVAFFILYVNNRRATVSGVEILVFSILLFFPAKVLIYFWLVVYSCYRQMKQQYP